MKKNGLLMTLMEQTSKRMEYYPKETRAIYILYNFTKGGTEIAD